MKDAKRYVAAWIALVALALLSFSLSGARLGALGVPVAFAIATMKGALVVLVFMHLARAKTSILVVVTVSVTLLALLVGFSAADVLTRDPAPLLPPM